MKLIIVHIFLLNLSLYSLSAQEKPHSFSDAGMHLDWTFDKSLIIFSVTTPSNGWQAIGFNRESELTGTYLIMTRVINGIPEVVEHYVNAPGDYQSISTLGENQRAIILEFDESKASTFIKFSIPAQSQSPYIPSFIRGTKYQMLYAYSLSDDFKHHSILRKSTFIKL